MPDSGDGQGGIRYQLVEAVRFWARSTSVGRITQAILVQNRRCSSCFGRRVRCKGTGDVWCTGAVWLWVELG
ncbi:hypothetical protein ES332_D04G204700v1 [Gossypium tomentosum]|uniref:Uncharacterized protein n=1 Tax=Gossypium tomentosum TaxID=34277 RepID=A0A5D2LGN7_GOSTO|nr:hypothetical protein ES332_D04G204700v1 [Gossypium tomentosum]